MNKDSNKYLTIVGGVKKSKFDGGQNISIPELSNLLKNKFLIYRIYRDIRLLELFRIKNIRKFVKSKIFIFNADFYKSYTIIIFLARIFRKKCIFIPRGAYNVTRLKINFLKKIYIFIVHYLYKENLVYLSESEIIESSDLIKRSPRKNLYVIPPTFNYLKKFVSNKKELKINNSIIFAGRPPSIYRNRIRDPKGFLDLLKLFPIINSYGFNVNIFSDLKEINPKLIKFQNYSINKSLEFKIFIKDLRKSDFLFQLSYEGEGFSQLIMQALYFKVKLIVNKRSLPDELIKITEEELELEIPENFFLSETKDNLNVLRNHLNGNMDYVHFKLFESALKYIHSYQKGIIKIWEKIIL